MFSVFFFFFLILKIKGELALAYENYADGILIVIIIETLNDCYLLYLVLDGNNEPFWVTNSTSSG